MAYWRMYPDRFLAFFEGEQPDFRLAPIQCVLLRELLREQEIFITGGRGITKSYNGLISRMVMGVLYPGLNMPYFGPSLKQTASIIRNTYKQIAKNYPMLAEMWTVQIDSNERFRLVTRYNSVIDVDVMRGSNAHCVFAEEVAQAEAGEQFDHEKFRSAVLPAVRLQRMLNGKTDFMFPNFQKAYITSAGRQQNESFEYRRDIMRDCSIGKRAFACDIPGSVAVLNGIRNIEWYNDMKRKLTPEEWLREMDARWTGACENPVVRDSVLTESKNNMLMENRHCGDPNVIYIISYDVSYADGARNAKCATIVLKLERQKDIIKRDRFMKTLVYCIDEDPSENMIQAKKLKERWYRFCLENGQTTYIAIDARSYGQAVLENLHKDLGDGLPPLCCVNHERPDVEQPGALPVIYAINATGGYATAYNDAHDNETDMLRYAEVEWEQRNVSILTSNISEGVLAYKRMHKIKDDLSDPTIAIPYIKCREMAGQMANLRKRNSGSGFKEERISRSINRDMWSAMKYGLRIAQRLEYQNLTYGKKKESDWEKAYKGELDEGPGTHTALRNCPTRHGNFQRRGGNLRR